MHMAVVNEDLCHSLTLTSKIIKEMTCRQHHQSLHQQYQQCKPQQKYSKYLRSEMLRFQFRIIMLPHCLQMRLFLLPNSFLTYILLVLLFVWTPPVCQAVGYSYMRFSGPVTGPEQKILVHDGLSGGGSGPRVDYIAKPAYEFAYGIEDAQARLLQNRQETRDGDAVSGSYSVVDPDGNLRVVKYTADHINGFQAEVTTNGLNTAIHGQHSPPQQTPPAPLWYYPHTVQNQVQQPQSNTEQNYNEENRAEANDDNNKGKANYEVNEDYEDDESDKEKHVKHKETDDQSEENYDNEDEHEDYDGNEHSAEASREATSYEEHSEEYY